MLGGNVSKSKSLILDLTVIGEVVGKSYKERLNSKKNDFIYVSGNIGDASPGLNILKNKRTFSSLEKRLISKYKSPKAKVDLGIFLGQLKDVTSMIDISDGLVQDLHHICKQSGTGAIIYEEKLPKSHEFSKVCRENSLNPLPFILEGGEDYELLFTLPSDGVKKLSRQFEKAKALVTHIGEITESASKVSLFRQNGKREMLHQLSGFNHF